MKTLTVSEFKKHCTQLLRDVKGTHEAVLITNRGRPVAKVIPVGESSQHPAWGALSGSVMNISEDFHKPLGDQDWEAAQ